MPLNAPLAGPGGSRSFLPRSQADPSPKPPSHTLVSLPRHACTRRLSQHFAGFRDFALILVTPEVDISAAHARCCRPRCQTLSEPASGRDQEQGRRKSTSGDADSASLHN